MPIKDANEETFVGGHLLVKLHTIEAHNKTQLVEPITLFQDHNRLAQVRHACYCLRHCCPLDASKLLTHFHQPISTTQNCKENLDL
mgnify:CR=1 FL=1